MGISFDQLPKEAPSSTLDDGIYRAKILEAKMRTPKDAAKKAYLELKLQLFNADGTKAAVMTDRIFDSDKQQMLFKLYRFLLATGLDFTGTVLELKDLVKLVVGKEYAIDVMTPAPQEGQRMAYPEAAIFSGDIYWTMAEYAGMVGVVDIPAADATPNNPFPAPVEESEVPLPTPPPEDGEGEY